MWSDKYCIQHLIDKIKSVLMFNIQDLPYIIDVTFLMTTVSRK